jgi:hypothetical protein
MNPSTRIHVFKTGLMQRMVTNVAHGYHWHYAGTVGADRVLAFIEQTDLQYAIDATPKQREYRRRRYDRANAFLHLHPSYGAPLFHWWLLLTDGDHSPPVPPSPLRDARGKGNQRLIVPGDYEAVLRPTKGGLPRRTWQLTTRSFEDVVVRLQEAIRHRKDPGAVQVVLREIHSYPAFRGVRSQVAKLRQIAVADWRRIRADGSGLQLPSFPPYVRYKTFETVNIGVVRDRLMAGKKPFAWELLARSPDRSGAREGSDAPLVEEDQTDGR